MELLYSVFSRFWVFSPSGSRLVKLAAAENQLQQTRLNYRVMNLIRTSWHKLEHLDSTFTGYPEYTRLNFGVMNLRYYEGQLTSISEVEFENDVETPPVRVAEAAQKRCPNVLHLKNKLLNNLISFYENLGEFKYQINRSIWSLFVPYEVYNRSF
ncbi:uncharacterized protein [Euphorbia lathyris]|uniref:uncharacterized protein isoform X2 n=1 Tax=Euphorbia lathyris TaxID=212925 RepID=UPI0033132739